MTIEQQDITQDFYSGNSKNILITVTDPNGIKDLTGCEVVFVMFQENKTDRVILRKTSNNPQEIDLTDATLGKMTIFLKSYDTLSIYGTFRYQVNVTDTSGETETVTTGKINIIRSYAARYRKNNIACYLSGQ